MRASVHVVMPRVMNHRAHVTATCERFRLSARRLFVSERDIIEKLFEGLGQLSSLGST